MQTEFLESIRDLVILKAAELGGDMTKAKHLTIEGVKLIDEADFELLEALQDGAHRDAEHAEREGILQTRTRDREEEKAAEQAVQHKAAGSYATD